MKSRALFAAVVLCKRFGWSDGRSMSVEDVARAHGVPRERVRAIENRFVRSVLEIARRGTR